MPRLGSIASQALPKSVIHRLLATLLAAGLVVRSSIRLALAFRSVASARLGCDSWLSATPLQRFVTSFSRPGRESRQIGIVDADG
jgi:hypothetical protein